MMDSSMHLQLGYLLITLLVGACFAFYYESMLRFFEQICDRKLPLYAHIAGGAVAYLFMIAVSLLGCPLYVNWTLLGLVYVAEMLVMFRVSPALAASMGMQAALLTLAINSITRALAALALNQPMAVFDSRYANEISNLKRYPIAAAFLLCALLFWAMRRALNVKHFQASLFEPARRRLFLAMSTSFFVYLDLNLLIYDTHGGENSIKLWCLKSAVCVLFGDLLFLSHIHTIAQYLEYEQKSRHARKELERGQRSNAALENAASYDVLTGCRTRAVGLAVLKDLFAQPGDLLLCYIDLNNLKTVNDKAGHNAGDAYLAAVGHALCTNMTTDATVFRYGGDEFVVVQPGGDTAALHRNMEQACRVLTGFSHTSQYPFAMSVSYGIATRQEVSDLTALLALADKRMYADKRQKKSETPPAAEKCSQL